MSSHTICIKSGYPFLTQLPTSLNSFQQARVPCKPARACPAQQKNRLSWCKPTVQRDIAIVLYL